MGPGVSLEMTRRLPEGPWDPTKIPRIQILMSQVVFLVGMGGLPSPQVEGQIEHTRAVREIQLDGPHRSHNPKVGGSNPPPATKRTKEEGEAGAKAFGYRRSSFARTNGPSPPGNRSLRGS
jgi:hypothetical protein